MEQAAQTGARLARWLLLLLSLLLPSGPARAGDPSLTWQTLRTEHFAIHCPTHLDAFCQRVARTAEEAWTLTVARLRWRPTPPVELVVLDQTDDANGLASSLPYNRIVAYAVPPEADGSLNDHDDWLRLLLYHETTHIVHLDQAGGLPAVINRLLGRTYLPNLVLPRWLHEGVAIWEESELTGGGRLRSSLFKGMLRQAALAGRLPGIDSLNTYPTAWPHGNSYYLYGSSFVGYLAETYGPEKLAHFTRQYGQRLIPYSLNRTARATLGVTLDEAWSAWQAQLTRWARTEQQELTTAGLFEGEPLTSSGEYHARPIFAPDGRRLLYALGEARELASLRIREPGDPTPAEGRSVVTTAGLGGAAWDPDGRTIVFHQQVVVDGLRSYYDLFRHDPRTGQTHRLTQGARARDPHVAPDGRLTWVASTAGRSRLMVGGRWAEAARELELAGVEVISTPRFAPDGRRIALSGWSPATGHRDLYLVDSQGQQPPQRLTQDVALDLDPAWNADGTLLYFASDRSGVFDIYAYGLQDGLVRRVTRVLGGAFAPAVTPDGRTLVYVALGADGYDLRQAELTEPESWPVVPAGGPWERHVRPRTYSSLPVVARQPTTPYSPWPSLLPRAYSPSFGATSLGQSWGVLVAGEDAVGLHRYLMQLEWSPEEKKPFFSGSWSYDGWYPTVTLSAGRWVQTYEEGYWAGGEALPYTEAGLHGKIRLSLPFSLYRTYQSVGLAYGATWYTPITGFQLTDPAGEAPRYPAAERVAGFDFSWSFSATERYTFSISPERGTLAYLGLSIRETELGSDVEQVVASFAVQQFLALPWSWSPHQVLSLRLAGGLGNGEPGARPSFTIGGPPSQDVILALVDETFIGNSGYLRGYPPGAASGDRYLLLNVDHRWPLWNPERGLGLVPLVVRRLVLAPFFDLGGASRNQLRLEELRRGLGTELRIDLTIGYYLDATLRLGYAWGLDEGGESQGYLLMGNAF